MSAFGNLLESEGDQRETPPDLFSALHERFQFTIDVAASETNAKLPRRYTRETNGLLGSWEGERVFCNPPFSDIESWIAKAWRQTDAQLVVMIIPANRTDRPWWHNLVEPYRDGNCGVWSSSLPRLRTEFLRGRPQFWPPGVGGPGKLNRPEFGCVLLIWSRT